MNLVCIGLSVAIVAYTKTKERIENEQESELKKQTTYVFRSRFGSGNEIPIVLFCVKTHFPTYPCCHILTKQCCNTQSRVRPMSLSALSLKAAPRSGFVIGSAHILLVGQYSTLISPLSCWSAMKKKNIDRSGLLTGTAASVLQQLDRAFVVLVHNILSYLVALCFHKITRP